MALQREKGQSDVMIERIADRVTLTFPERIVFDPGQARLKPTCQTTLEKVASFIHDRPFLFVEVQGHTDDRPINTSRYPSNWELSVDWAMQVSRALIGLGVKPTQLSVRGFGEYRPLIPNDSDASRSDESPRRDRVLRFTPVRRAPSRTRLSGIFRQNPLPQSRIASSSLLDIHPPSCIIQLVPKRVHITSVALK